jgi:hypothetical protein
MYCLPKNQKEWKKLRHFFDVGNMIRLRNRGKLCVFFEKPFPHIIDCNYDEVELNNEEPKSIDDFMEIIHKRNYLNEQRTIPRPTRD